MENQERFRSLFDNNPNVVFMFDLEGEFTHTNSECSDLTGYPPDRLIKMSFNLLKVPEDLATAIYYFKEAIRGNINRYKISIIRKDGFQRALEVTCFSMSLAGEIVGAYGNAKYITERNAHRKLMEDLVLYDPLTKLPNRIVCSTSRTIRNKYPDSRNSQNVPSNCQHLQNHNTRKYSVSA